MGSSTELTKRTKVVDVNLDSPTIWEWLLLGPQRQVILPSEARPVPHRPSERMP